MPTADLGTDPRINDVFRTVSGVNLDIGPFDRLRGTAEKVTNQHSTPRFVSSSCPRIVLKDSLGYELDTYTTLQEAIYRAKWNVRRTGHAQTPLEWRLPKAPPPARPDLTRTFPPVKHPQLQAGLSRQVNNVPSNILEIDVDDVSFVKESLDRLPFVPSLSFLRQEFLVGPKTYFQIVGTMLLHKKLLTETEKRHAIYNFPGFCSGCIRMGLCYGCERSTEPHYHEDKLVKTGGGFTYYKKDRPERELKYRNPINWKINHPDQVLKKLMEDYTGVTLEGDISEKVQEHLDEYGDRRIRQSKETGIIDRNMANVDGSMSTRQATRGDDGRFLPEIDPRYINEQQEDSSLLGLKHVKENLGRSQSGDRGIDPDEVDIEMFEDPKGRSKSTSKKSTQSLLDNEDESSGKLESALDIPDTEYLQSDTDTGRADDVEKRYIAKIQRTFNDNRRYEHRLPKYRKTDTDDDTEDEERRKNYEADDESRGRKKERLYKPPPAFKLKKSPKRRIDSKSPFSTDRSYDIPKGREFVPRKSSKKPTEFVDFRNVDVSWKEPKKFELKKASHKPTKFWSGIKNKKKEKSRSRSPKIRRAPSPRSVSPDSGLDTGFITARIAETVEKRLSRNYNKPRDELDKTTDFMNKGKYHRRSEGEAQTRRMSTVSEGYIEEKRDLYQARGCLQLFDKASRKRVTFPKIAKLQTKQRSNLARKRLRFKKVTKGDNDWTLPKLERNRYFVTKESMKKKDNAILPPIELKIRNLDETTYRTNDESNSINPHHLFKEETLAKDYGVDFQIHTKLDSKKRPILNSKKAKNLLSDDFCGQIGGENECNLTLESMASFENVCSCENDHFKQTHNCQTVRICRTSDNKCRVELETLSNKTPFHDDGAGTQLFCNEPPVKYNETISRPFSRMTHNNLSKGGQNEHKNDPSYTENLIQRGIVLNHSLAQNCKSSSDEAQAAIQDQYKHRLNDTDSETDIDYTMCMFEQTKKNPDTAGLVPKCLDQKIDLKTEKRKCDTTNVVSDLLPDDVLFTGNTPNANGNCIFPSAITDRKKVSNITKRLNVKKTSPALGYSLIDVKLSNEDAKQTQTRTEIIKLKSDMEDSAYAFEFQETIPNDQRTTRKRIMKNNTQTIATKSNNKENDDTVGSSVTLTTRRELYDLYKDSQRRARTETGDNNDSLQSQLSHSSVKLGKQLKTYNNILSELHQEKLTDDRPKYKDLKERTKKGPINSEGYVTFGSSSRSINIEESDKRKINENRQTDGDYIPETSNMSKTHHGYANGQNKRGKSKQIKDLDCTTPTFSDTTNGEHEGNGCKHQFFPLPRNDRSLSEWRENVEEIQRIDFKSKSREECLIKNCETEESNFADTECSSENDENSDLEILNFSHSSGWHSALNIIDDVNQRVQDAKIQLHKKDDAPVDRNDACTKLCVSPESLEVDIDRYNRESDTNMAQQVCTIRLAYRNHGHLGCGCRPVTDRNYSSSSCNDHFDETIYSNSDFCFPLCNSDMNIISKPETSFKIISGRKRSRYDNECAEREYCYDSNDSMPEKCVDNFEDKYYRNELHESRKGNRGFSKESPCIKQKTRNSNLSDKYIAKGQTEIYHEEQYDTENSCVTKESELMQSNHDYNSKQKFQKNRSGYRRKNHSLRVYGGKSTSYANEINNYSNNSSLGYIPSAGGNDQRLYSFKPEYRVNSGEKLDARMTKHIYYGKHKESDGLSREENEDVGARTSYSTSGAARFSDDINHGKHYVMTELNNEHYINIVSDSEMDDTGKSIGTGYNRVEFYQKPGIRKGTLQQSKYQRSPNAVVPDSSSRQHFGMSESKRYDHHRRSETVLTYAKIKGSNRRMQKKIANEEGSGSLHSDKQTETSVNHMNGSSQNESIMTDRSVRNISVDMSTLSSYLYMDDSTSDASLTDNDVSNHGVEGATKKATSTAYASPIDPCTGSSVRSACGTKVGRYKKSGELKFVREELSPPHIPSDIAFDKNSLTSAEPDLELEFDDIIDVGNLEICREENKDMTKINRREDRRRRHKHRKKKRKDGHVDAERSVIHNKHGTEKNKDILQDSTDIEKCLESANHYISRAIEESDDESFLKTVQMIDDETKRFLEPESNVDSTDPYERMVESKPLERARVENYNCMADEKRHHDDTEQIVNEYSLDDFPKPRSSISSLEKNIFYDGNGNCSHFGRHSVNEQSRDTSRNSKDRRQPPDVAQMIEENSRVYGSPRIEDEANKTNRKAVDACKVTIPQHSGRRNRRKKTHSEVIEVDFSELPSIQTQIAKIMYNYNYDGQANTNRSSSRSSKQSCRRHSIATLTTDRRKKYRSKSSCNDTRRSSIKSRSKQKRSRSLPHASDLKSLKDRWEPEHVEELMSPSTVPDYEGLLPTRVTKKQFKTNPRRVPGRERSMSITFISEGRTGIKRCYNRQFHHSSERVRTEQSLEKMSEFKLKSTTPKRVYLYVNPYTHDYEISNIPPRYQVYHTGNYVGSFLSHKHFAEKGVYRITRVLDQTTFDKRHRVDDVTTNICFTCDRSGHWASQCPEKENQMWRFVFVFVNTHTHDVEIHPIKEMDWDSQHMKYVGSLLSYKVDENKRKTKPSQPTISSSGKGQRLQKSSAKISSGSEEKKINDKTNDKTNEPSTEKQIENQIEREIENMELDNTEISDTEICRIQIDYPVKKKISSGKLSSEKKINEQSSQKASSAPGEGKDKKLSSEKKEDTIILDQKSGEVQNNEQTVQKSSPTEEKKISDKPSPIGDNQINDKINKKPSSVPGEGKNKKPSSGKPSSEKKINKISSEKKIRREGKKICSDIELRRRWKSDVVKNNEKKRKSDCEPDIPKKKRKLCL